LKGYKIQSLIVFCCYRSAESSKKRSGRRRDQVIVQVDLGTARDG